MKVNISIIGREASTDFNVVVSVTVFQELLRIADKSKREAGSIYNMPVLEVSYISS